MIISGFIYLSDEKNTIRFLYKSIHLANKKNYLCKFNLINCERFFLYAHEV